MDADTVGGGDMVGVGEVGLLRGGVGPIELVGCRRTGQHLHLRSQNVSGKIRQHGVSERSHVGDAERSVLAVGWTDGDDDISASVGGRPRVEDQAHAHVVNACGGQK